MKLCVSSDCQQKHEERYRGVLLGHGSMEQCPHQNRLVTSSSGGTAEAGWMPAGNIEALKCSSPFALKEENRSGFESRLCVCL